MLVYLIAILPALLIAFYVYQIDRHDREAHKILLLCFFIGMAVTIPAIKIESFETSLPTINGHLTLGALLFSTFILVAVVEELFKSIPLLFFARPKKYFNEPLDAIVFAVMIAMGFALVENIFYAYEYGWQTTLIRAFTAVPAHGALAVIMGHYVGLSKFHPERKYSLLAMGIGQVILIHGLYDFFIIQEYNEDLMAFTALILTLSLYYAIRIIRRHKAQALYLPAEPIAPEIPVVAVEENNEIAEAVFRSLEEEE